jgi:hypothetical protein
VKEHLPREHLAKTETKGRKERGNTDPNQRWLAS